MDESERRVKERPEELVDITQTLREKNAERRASEETRRRFEFSMEHAPDAVFFMTREAGFSYVNRQACRSLGYTRDELLRLKVWDIDPIYPRERWERVWKQEQQEEVDTVLLETLHRRKDGTLFPVEVSAEHLRLGEYEFHVAFARDITARKRAEEALREAETRLRLALQAGRIGIWDWSIATGQLVWSRGHEELWGFPAGAFKGTYAEFEERLHPEDRAELNRVLAEAIAARRMFRHEFRIVWPDGSVHWIAGQGEPFFDDTGNPVRMIGVARDITEQRRAEEEVHLLRTISLAVSESPNLATALCVMMEKICEATGWEIGQAWIPQPDGNALACSPVWYRRERTGRFEKLRITSKETILHPGEGLPGAAFSSKQPIWVRDLSKAERCLRAQIAGEAGLKSGFAVPVLAGDQVMAVLEWYVSASREEDERLIRLVSTLASQLGVVIGRKRSEEALAAEKTRLTVTLRSICDGVITTDTAGKIVLMNQVAEGLTGTAQEEAFGQPLHQVFSTIDEKSRQPLENPVTRALETGATVTPPNPTILISRDGTERIISDSAAPIRDQQGEIIGVVLVFRNITDEKKKEEDLLRISKLEAVGLLAGGIAHDFNNILTAILGNLSLIKMELDPVHPLYRRVEDAETASLRARDLSYQLLTFSKGGTPIKKTLAIKPLLEHSIQFALRGSNVRPEFFISEALWPVDIDEGQISQVLNNLAINAQQAMPEGGPLHIRAENYVATKTQKRLPIPAGRYIHLSIQDFGVGIKREHLDKIFDPYFTTKQQGNGFGLSTSCSIVKKHHGHMTVHSKVGKGSTFSIYLPASSKKMEASATAEIPRRGKGKILVMDDDEAIRKVAGEMLGFLGYDAGFAEDEKEANLRYREAMESGRPFDLVIMDLTIPGKTGGREALQKLLEIDPEVKAIVSSGYSNDPIMAAYTRYGFKGVIAKPYKMEDLSKTLQKVIANQSK
ncbi:MAG: PAS domain S-box protein [Nitrospirae bacterium]|nr:PAS domain S-box protein [Candidatus Manganitrophaceae bacterium]